MAADVPVKAEPRDLCQRDVEKMLAYVFRFVDPIEIGRIFQHEGYTPATEVSTLIDIATGRDENGPLYGPYARMGAIKMLQEMRQKALELSGAIVQRTEERKGKGQVETMRTIRVTQNVAGYLKPAKEQTYEQLPGDHKPPRIGLSSVPGEDVPLVREGALRGREGAEDSPGSLPQEASGGGALPGGRDQTVGASGTSGHAETLPGATLEERLDGTPGLPVSEMEGEGRDDC